jgi:hypothetical protein
MAIFDRRDTKLCAYRYLPLAPNLRFENMRCKVDNGRLHGARFAPIPYRGTGGRVPHTRTDPSALPEAMMVPPSPCPSATDLTQSLWPVNGLPMGVPVAVSHPYRPILAAGGDDGEAVNLPYRHGIHPRADVADPIVEAFRAGAITLRIGRRSHAGRDAEHAPLMWTNRGVGRRPQTFAGSGWRVQRFPYRAMVTKLVHGDLRPEGVPFFCERTFGKLARCSAASPSSTGERPPCG